MGITLTSLGRPPSQLPMTGDKQINTLLLILSNQTQFVANDWAKLSSARVMFEPPKGSVTGSRPIFPNLPFPLVLTEGQADGELKGSFWILMGVKDALTACSMMMETPAPGEEVSANLDPTQADAVHELFNIYCGSADRAMCKGVDEQVRLHQGSTRIVGSASDPNLPPIRPGWLIEIKFKIGDRTVQVWELVPQGLGGDIVEYYRDEMANQVSVVCGGVAEPTPKIGIKGKILVVDPVPSTQNTMKMYLEKEGFEMVGVESGAQAITLTSRECPRAVIQEYLLPDMSGLELSKTLRQRYGKEELPIIFCSTNTLRPEIIKAVQAGATHYIMKPFTRDLFVSKVLEATRMSQVAS
jgi:CheY-like chemotaxis protein